MNAERLKHKLNELIDELITESSFGVPPGAEVSDPSHSSIKFMENMIAPTISVLEALGWAVSVGDNPTKELATIAEDFQEKLLMVLAGNNQQANTMGEKIK